MHKRMSLHGDADHCGNSKSLIDSFNVKKVYLNKGKINNCEKKANGNILYEDYLKIDNVEVHSLNNGNYNDENSLSMVLLLLIDNYKILLMGDSPKNVEEQIIKKNNLNNIDLLKVGHRGSNTSSSKNFIGHIKPKYSIISVGENNKFGHPNKEVLNNLNNSKIYRTDQDGSIMFKIKKNKLRIETYSP